MRMRWTVEQTTDWAARQPWRVGCNYVVSTAVNQIAMWQAETFDPERLALELGWAADCGLNAVRVFLHDQVWRADPAGFRQRVDCFLTLAAERGLGVMPVLFDDCWHDGLGLGPQPAPVPGVHNSRWAMTPGLRAISDRRLWPQLEAYVRDVVSAFADDARVFVWDVYNEPSNFFMPALTTPQPARIARLLTALARRVWLRSRSLDLLTQAFAWARAAQPIQPLTAGLWFDDVALNRHLIALSDVISFHNYNPVPDLERQIAHLHAEGRPLFCTEYLARNKGSCFESHLPVFARTHVGAFHWGLVAGQTQTIYPWTHRGLAYTHEALYGARTRS